MSGTTWQCKDNSTFKASACFDSIFFFGEGEVKVRSELEDRFVDQKKKKTPKKKKKGRKIKEREKQTKNTALHDM